MNLNKIFTTVLVLCSCAALVFGVKLYKLSAEKPAPSRNELRALGFPDSRIQIIEHMDYHCHMCKEASEELANFMQQHPSEIYLQVRFHFFDSKPNGRTAALFAECATQQGKFWDMHKLLFKYQEEWAESTNADTYFYSLAQTIQLDRSRLQACTENMDTLKTILNERANGILDGVQSTPTFFINGKMVVGLPLMKQELENLLKKEEAAS